MSQHQYLMSTLDFRDVTFQSGEGAVLFSDGKKYLDFFADVGTASLGYNSPEQQHALARMIGQGIPLHAPNLYRFAERDRAAEGLCKLTEMDKVFFCNSGTEAVEAAIKLARKYQDGAKSRHTIWSYKGGFHGRTYGGLSAGDGPRHHYAGFGPLLEGFEHFTEIGEIEPDAAAVMLAPIFGNNDVAPYPPEWLHELRLYTKANGILLIFDEVQTGSGRTGAPTYAQKIGVKPDIITLAKGLGMGCPVGAALATSEVASAFTPGSHFSTFGGNPLSCVFVNEMVGWLSNRRNLEEVNQKGVIIRKALQEMEWPKNVRGEGMLIAFDMDKDGLEFSKVCLTGGLLIGAFRAGAGAVKVTPPLNTPLDQIYRGLAIMAEAHDKL